MKIYKKFGLILILILKAITPNGQSNNCPDPETILPCRCSLKGKETQIWCSHSNLPLIMQGIKSIEKQVTQFIDELILENNHLPALPGRFFGALKISRLMLRHNNIERLSNGWLNELEKALVEIFIVEPKLRSIPAESLHINGFQKLEAVTIQSNELRRLPNFSGLVNLKYLSVKSKSLNDLPPQNLKHLPKLQNIQISGGENLFHLEGGLFDGLPSLKTIDLSYNRITTIHLRTFYNLPNLISINLSNNKINNANMVGRALKDLENLQKLNLNNNEINILPEGSFVALKSLKELYLNGNQITEIQYNSFHETPNLKIIYLQSNNIRRIHPESFVYPTSTNVEILYLNDNQIDRIEELRSILDGLPNLKFLDLTKNLLFEIPFGALRGHGMLEQLYLNDNLIHVIERDALMAMPALRELRLRNNSISDSLDMPFWNLPNLKGLDLAQNQFREINAVLLAGLPFLRRLDISQNYLIMLNSATFIHSPMIETLNISNNGIKLIHPATFRNLYRLFEIDLNQNHLQEMVQGLPKVIERLSLRSNMISTLKSPTVESLNLPNLRMLDLSNNVIEYIPKLTFQSMNQLRVLSLAQNRIRKIEEDTFLGVDDVELLDLQQNFISFIDENSLKAMKNLRNLNLHANKMEALKELLFLNTTNMEQLDLSQNNLQELPPLIFQNLKYLQYLDMSNNLLTAMPESLSHLLSLRDLDISFNQLIYLPSVIINALKNIIEIRLSNNRFHELKQDTISNLPKLQYLDLSSNEIDSIETGALKNLPDLQELVLADNKLQELNDNVIEVLPNLQAAHLQHNNLKYMSSDSFYKSTSIMFLNLSVNNFHKMEHVGLRNLRSLEVLDLSHNKIQVVDTMPLKTLNWLVELKMDDNQICKIHGTAFENMPRLRVLSLRNNKLRTMQERTFRNIRGNIAVFDIDGNPIQCSCEMFWLSVWLDETNSPHPGPKCVNGKLLRSSIFEKNDCSNYVRSSNQLPLLNDHGDLFSQRLLIEDNGNCEQIQFNNQNELPPPNESEYFYDQYIDYPMNETHEIKNNSNNNFSNDIQYQSNSNTKNTNNLLPPNLNKTILNFNLHNRPTPNLQNSSPFTFFGYPLPSIGLNRYFGQNARKTDSTFRNRGVKGMHLTNNSYVEKYLQNENQYSDISARHRFINTDSHENQNAEDNNSFRTSFKNPKLERGGFFPIMPFHVSGFIPVQPHRKLSNQTLSSSSDVTTQTSGIQNERYIPIAPIKSVSIESTTGQNTMQEFSYENDSLKDQRSSISSIIDNEKVNQSHSYLETDENEIVLTTIQNIPESVENSETAITYEKFFPTSTLETILLIPPAEEHEQSGTTNKQVIDDVDENLKISATKTRIPHNITNLNGSRSKIVKVFTPQSLLNLPTAEEYYRTTMSPSIDNEYQQNEYFTSIHKNEDLIKKPGIEWYYDNYKSKTNKVQLLNEIETERPIRRNGSAKNSNKFIAVIFVLKYILNSL